MSAEFPESLPPVPFVVRSSIFETVSDEVGRSPSQTPLTVVTASTVIFVLPTPVTLAKLTTSKVGLEYLMILPEVTIPTKVNPGVTGTEMSEVPLDSPEILAVPKLRT